MKNPIEFKLRNGCYICIDIDSLKKIEEYSEKYSIIHYSIIFDLCSCDVEGSYQQIFEYIANYKRND